MQRYQNLLLDLDGTLTDPMIGITKSVQYALGHFGITVNDLKELYPFIGPPLKDSFKEYYNLSDEQTETAQEKYRERYVATGMYENYEYEGIKDFLSMAKANGYNLYLATSKPIDLAEEIIEHFGLTSYFTFLGGSTTDGSRTTKEDVVRYVLETNRITDLSSTVMIGDRKYDVIGAKLNNISSIGVLYGYGSYEELTEAGADYIVEDLNGLAELLGFSFS